jgi:phospholipid transport system substrate-binding protein
MIRRLVVAALVALVSASPVAAGEPTERLRALFEEGNRILLGDRPLEERLDAVRALVDDAFDTREAAALALGREWHARSAAEREEFVRVYADLVERAYLAWLGARARVHSDGVRIEFESESVHGDRATVATRLDTRGSGALPIEYHMSRHTGRWAVHDVVVEGVSLAGSYRAQFDRILRTGTYADLRARLLDAASDATLIALAREKAPSAPAPVRVASAAPASDAPSGPLLLAAVASPLAVVPAPVVPRASAAVAAPLPPPIVVGRPAVAAPATASAPPATPAAPVVPKRFWVQVGAFRSTEALSRLVERLRLDRITVAAVAARSGSLARVLVGPFADRAAAAEALRQLTAGGHGAFIALE